MCRILPRCEIRIEAGDDRLPSNGLAFSCRERAARDHVKIARIARAAVSWNARLCENTDIRSGQARHGCGTMDRSHYVY